MQSPLWMAKKFMARSFVIRSGSIRYWTESLTNRLVKLVMHSPFTGDPHTN
jgi:hypothetical protein